MSDPGWDTQRIRALEKILDIEYDKRSQYEEQIALCARTPNAIELRQRFKREVLPDIQRYEKEYADLLARRVNLHQIPAGEAEKSLADVTHAIDGLDRHSSQALPDEGSSLLVEIRKIVDDREKTAAAKLKVALPIILLLVSCEMELDTEIALQSVWKQLRTLFRSKV